MRQAEKIIERLYISDRVKYGINIICISTGNWLRFPRIVFDIKKLKSKDKSSEKQTASI